MNGVKNIIVFIVFSAIGISTSYAQITEQEFTELGRKLRKIYEPKAQSTGETLYMNLDWNDSNMAYADHYENYKQYAVTVTGDHARLPGMTPDAFALLLCHEFGHLFGGAPLKSPLISAEGQSDYYSTQKCFKRLIRDDYNFLFLAQHWSKITTEMQSQCSQVYSFGSDYNICLRGMLAAETLIRAKNPGVNVSLSEKDPEEVSYTNFDHPNAQCRLDTLVAGLLYNGRGHKFGLRPRCWFNSLE